LPCGFGTPWAEAKAEKDPAAISKSRLVIGLYFTGLADRSRRSRL
jgi:hypothetical protein